MNLRVTIGLFFLLAILGEAITREIFKYARPYKFYHPRSRSHKSRPYSYHGSYQRGASKYPSKHAYHYGPPRGSGEIWQESHRYPENHLETKEPYTIEIELPNRPGASSWSKDYRNQRPRNRDVRAGENFYSVEEDYTEDFEDRALQTMVKGVKIKVTKGPQPKLRIKFSRDDSMEEIDRSSNIDAVVTTAQPNLSQPIDKKDMVLFYVPPTVEPFRRFLK